MGSLKLFDVVKFSLLDPNLMKVKDDYAGAFKQDPQGQTHHTGMGTVPGTGAAQPNQLKANGLLVRLAATHSGIITRNNGFYLPDKMRTGAASFTANYPKPVLLHHNDHQDPVGRIIASTYRDTSGAIADKYNGLQVKDKKGNAKGTISDTLIKDFVSGKMPFGMQVDTVTSLLRDSVLEDQGYDGLGYIEIAADITDTDAIQKLLDGRYLTGSVGATTDAAVCSVCRQDWTETGQCEHKPGGIYDGVKCFIIAGTLVYDEYSFVNVPADRHSKVLELNYNGIQDKVQLDNTYSGRIYEVKLGFPQYDPKEDSGMKIESKTVVQDSAATATQSTTEAAPPAPVVTAPAEAATAVSTDAAAPTTDKVEDAKPAEGTVAAASTETAATTTETVTPPAATEQVQDSKKVDDLITKVLDEKTESISDEEEEALYDMLWKELVAAVKDGELVMEASELKDAKLSTEKRKSLAKSSFCGPNRSFPVPDCAHVTAARRLIGRYKGPGSKDSILACVSRKAKAMGCDTKSKDSSKKEKDNLNHTRMMHMVLGLLEQDLYYSQEATLSDEELDSLSKVLKRLSTMVMEDNFKKGLEKAGIKVESPKVDKTDVEKALLDEVAKLEETIGDLRDRLDANRKEYTSLYQDFEALQDSLVKEKKETRKVKEGMLSTLRALRDHKLDSAQDLSAKSDSDLQTEIDQALKVVDMVKITDKLGDGMSRTPSGEVNSPVEITDNTTNQKRTVDVNDLKKIEETFVSIRLSKGQRAAEAYLDTMKKQGRLPQE